MARDSLPVGLVGLVAVAAILFWPRKSYASIPGQEIVIPPDAVPPPFNPGVEILEIDWGDQPVTGDETTDYGGGYHDPVYGDAWSSDDFSAPPVQPIFDLYPPDYGQPVVMDYESDPMANLQAFLYMLRCAETGTERADSGESYTTFYGDSQFYSTADHPVITGEKVGVPLPDEFCRAAGLKPGCVSTAAGAYQITRPTWDQFRAAGSWGPYLPDFSPESQDEAARRILMFIGAIPYIENGNIEAAIVRASQRWASMPSSAAGQGGVKMASALAYFNEGLA